MRNHDTLTKALIVLSSFFVLSCQHVELPETQQHKIVASVGAYNTKANFHMTETPNVLCEWNGRETLRVYYKRSNGKYHSTFANAPVARVEEEGKSADFTFSPEQAWGFNGNVSSYPVAIFTVNCFPTIDPEDGSIYLDARLVRQPLKDFELPVYYVGEVVNGTVEATFSHYYAYEFLHVKNTSDKTIEFSLNGYETPWIWYKKLASVGLEDGVVYNKSWSGLTPAEVSYPVSIAPGSSDIIVSAYIPNDFIVKDAAIVAAIDGIIVKSTNKKSSAAPLVPGRAYHMYAGWNGQELKFWKDGEEPLDVRTLSASIDPQYLSGEFTGTVVNPPLSEIKTGFRFWKENYAEDYVEYDSTSSDNSSFCLNLAYEDFVNIANESPVEGKYFVSAFAIDAKGTRHPGNVLEFTIESGQPVVPEAVDLGLSVKWASFNVGATKPEEYGGHYAWGEIEEKTAYDWSTYKWSDGDSNRLIKYCTESTDGYIDGKTTLDLDDDVAHVCFGDNWRMPTKSELDELIQKCTWRWTTKNGVSGYEVTGANGNSVFLPSAGVRDNSNHGGTDPLTGQYWSSTLCDEMTSIDSHYLYCGSNDYLLSDASRYRGLSVRPVYDDSDQKPEIKTPEIVDLGLSVKWASFNLGATKPEEYGDYYAWGETEPYYSNLDPLTWKEGKEAGYNWASYKWCMGTYSTLTKYCTYSIDGYNRFTDGKTVLDPEDDAAHVNLGGNWRMPTSADWEELIYKCTWTWTTQNGVNGRRITGPNGNRIFLPAAGHWSDTNLYPWASGTVDSSGLYWSSSIYDLSYDAQRVYFFSGHFSMLYDYRYNGFSVRPVYDDSELPVVEVTPTDIEFGTVPYGSSSTKYVTVKNIGSGVLSFTVENVSAPFSVTPTSYALSAGESVQLAFTFTPASATSGAGGRCTIVSNATQSVVSVTYSGSGTESGVSTPEAIDLGLPSGLKWASFNLGASKPEEYGDYYAWGETEPYYSSMDPLTWKEGKESGYIWSSYKWCNGSYTTMTKYCTEYNYGYNGFTDDKTVLDPEDDAAYVNLGGSWRMPTDAEWTELREKCTWTWTTQNGVSGRLVTGSNGNSIFLPAAGYWIDTRRYPAGPFGYYWSSSLRTDNPNNALRVFFSDGGVLRETGTRSYGFSVRPVTE